LTSLPGSKLRSGNAVRRPSYWDVMQRAVQRLVLDMANVAR
jgi:hypothetical protein